MENSDKEAGPGARPPSGKSPTRLQKHAPAALQLDGIENNGNTEPYASSSCAIPLLSPLVLSPQFSHEAEEIRLAGNGNDERDHNELGATPASGGWQHPAVDALTEPSTLLAFFQSQCTIVNRVQ
ncbi:unnamed protein product [Ilex paraguariensis]|uniref:Uncharacterized protein n=1 Tax=Ilex paraguariensis TaxID=185542 RepID=A0ABC8SDQ6_9AQUA